MAEKIPLSEQLDEIRAEYTRRCQMYPELVIRGQMRRYAAEFKIERMAAAYNTLSWLLKNADHIKEWVIFATKIGTPADACEATIDAPPDVLPAELAWEEPGGDVDPPAEVEKAAAE
jgi:hypothetical protein